MPLRSSEPAATIPLRFRCSCGEWLFVATYCVTCPGCRRYWTFARVAL